MLYEVFLLNGNSGFFSFVSLIRSRSSDMNGRSKGKNRGGVSIPCFSRLPTLNLRAFSIAKFSGVTLLASSLLTAE